ncbi:Acyl-CoA N-acyltransferase [Niveomyces insectorum RCEF 264]|uniref:Acyl-CoA N-acyltransferase n=1 Tax=Niveomyces insectorum RCEF 264 TaxID=1081102 RepID=A0A167ZZZ6_9HYPO|nr:Acyl-CoA N-acyltransferase [Niveomyces insectorum RCEF 264]
MAATQLFQAFYSREVSDDMLAEAARLFSEHYGVWGEGGFGKPGRRVRMSATRLRDQVLPAGVDGTLVTATLDGVYAGHVFGCRWTAACGSDDGTGPLRVCWVTQLVVHRDYRERGLATYMLRVLRGQCGSGSGDVDGATSAVDVFGILSSQPAACLALARAVGGPGDLAPRFPSYVRFTRDAAKAVLAASPVPYVRSAKIIGGAVAPVTADTKFFVDHAEPRAALARFQAQRGHPFPLGDHLPAGHEFLLLVPLKKKDQE